MHPRSKIFLPVQRWQFCVYTWPILPIGYLFMYAWRLSGDHMHSVLLAWTNIWTIDSLWQQLCVCVISYSLRLKQLKKISLDIDLVLTKGFRVDHNHESNSLWSSSSSDNILSGVNCCHREKWDIQRWELNTIELVEITYYSRNELYK